MFTTFTTTIFFIRVGRCTLQLIYTHFVFSTYIERWFCAHITHQMIQWEIEAEFFFCHMDFRELIIVHELPETGAYNWMQIVFTHERWWNLALGFQLFHFSNNSIGLLCSCFYICFGFHRLFSFSRFMLTLLVCDVSILVYTILVVAIFIYTIQYLGRVTQIMPFLITFNFRFHPIDFTYICNFSSQHSECSMTFVIYICFAWF